MQTQPFVIERVYNADTARVWSAITNKEEMKQWYFNLAEFRAEVGFKFTFTGGPTKEEQYMHLCEVTEVVPGKKLTYSWAYEGYAGMSFVTFELFSEGDKTRLKLSHTGLETFPPNRHFAAHNFAEGWTSIIGKSLKRYLGHTDTEDYKGTINVKATPKEAFDSLTSGIKDWWTSDFDGQCTQLRDTFTVRFGKTQKTMLVTEFTPDTRVTWKCIEAYINSKDLNNKSEWVGTKMVWDIAPEGDATKITLTHIGLTPGAECFEICSDGWNHYFKGSLAKYLNKTQ